MRLTSFFKMNRRFFITSSLLLISLIDFSTAAEILNNSNNNIASQEQVDVDKNKTNSENKPQQNSIDSDSDIEEETVEPDEKNQLGEKKEDTILIKAPENKKQTLQVPEEPIDQANATTEILLGCSQDESPIYIYISPSCLHCAKFLLEDLNKFLEAKGAIHKVVIRFLPTCAKDVFIMKLMEHKAKALAKEKGDISKSMYEFYHSFLSYIQHVTKVINSIEATNEQLEMYKGSNTDKEMIKYQIAAKTSGLFSDDEIINAIPDPEFKEKYEVTLINSYRDSLEYISKIINSKELDLPLIIKNEIRYKTIEEASNASETQQPNSAPNQQQPKNIGQFDIQNNTEETPISNEKLNL